MGRTGSCRTQLWRTGIRFVAAAHAVQTEAEALHALRLRVVKRTTLFSCRQCPAGARVNPGSDVFANACVFLQSCLSEQGSNSVKAVRTLRGHTRRLVQSLPTE